MSGSSDAAKGRADAEARQSFAIPLVLVWLSIFLVSLDFSAINVALPTLTAYFHASTSGVSWASIAYMLSMVTLLPVSGFLIARIGPGRSLTLGLAVFAAASAGAALSGSLALLGALRAIQGCGAAIMYVIGPVLIRSCFPDLQQKRAFALYATGSFTGLVAGPVVGGAFTEAFGWQAVFWMNLPMSAVAFVLARVFFGRTPSGAEPLSRRMPRPISVAGLSLSVGALVLALNQGQEWGWRSLPILTLFGLGAAAAAAVWAAEQSAQVRLVDAQILDAGGFVTATLIIAAVSAGMGGLNFVLPFYFEWFRGLDTDAMGRTVSILPLATVATSILLGLLPSGPAARTQCIAGLVAVLAGYGALIVADHATPVPALLAALALVGCGIGLTLPALLHASLLQVPPDLVAPAGSAQATLRVLSQLLGLVAFETILSQLSPGTFTGAPRSGAVPADMQSGFHAVFICGALLALAAVPALARLKPGSARNEKGST
ncbi:MAG: MFS transporter [Rhodobacteraceae bacterium]|nr:MFS transporter [Paracoccaceae bacterium]